MVPRPRHLLPAVLAAAGFGLLGTSAQTVTSLDAELRSSVGPVPVQDVRDCPYEEPANDREV